MSALNYLFLQAQWSHHYLDTLIRRMINLESIANEFERLGGVDRIQYHHSCGLSCGY
jgi:hypothetical protein